MPLAIEGIQSSDIEKLGHARKDPSDINLKRTTKLSFLNLKGIPGIRHPKPWDSIVRFALTFKFLVVVIAVGICCFSWYWWVLSIITMLPVAYVFLFTADPGPTLPWAAGGNAILRALLLGPPKRFDRLATGEEEWWCSKARNEIVACIPCCVAKCKYVLRFRIFVACMMTVNLVHSWTCCLGHQY